MQLFARRQNGSILLQQTVVQDISNRLHAGINSSGERKRKSDSLQSSKCVSFSRTSLEDRLKLEEHSGTSNMADSAVGSKQLTFTLKKVNHTPSPRIPRQIGRKVFSMYLVLSRMSELLTVLDKLSLFMFYEGSVLCKFHFNNVF